MGRKRTLYQIISPLHRALHHAEKRKVNLGEGETCLSVASLAAAEKSQELSN